MTTIEPIRRSVSVNLAPERAFTLFTDEMGTWWPLTSYSRAVDEYDKGTMKSERLEFQGRLGGRILEHLSNGEVVPWAEVLAWEPPARFVLAWKPNATDRPPTELEVHFVAEGTGTRVEVEHRGWERLGDDATRARTQYDNGWPMVLGLFVETAGRGAAS